jgi:hypothetical protein
LTWAEVRRAYEGSYAGYLADLKLAWSYAYQNTTSKAIAYQVRYALIQSSINSLAGNIPGELLVGLVREHMWDSQAALGYALQIPGADERVSALNGLGSVLLDRGEQQLAHDAFEDALAAIRKIKYETARADAITKLAPNLPSDLLVEALAVANETLEGYWCFRGLTALAPYLLPDLRQVVLSDALTIAYGLKDYDSDQQWQPVAAITMLVPHLPQDQHRGVLSDALAIVSMMSKDFNRARALTRLAPLLPPDMLEKALAAARGIQDEIDRGLALGGLAPHLSPDERPAALAEALAVGTKVQDDDPDYWADVLIQLTPILPVDLLDDALVVANSLQSSYEYLRVLTQLAPHLSPELLATVLAEVRASPRDFDSAFRLAALALHLPDSERLIVFSEALETGSKLKDPIDIDVWATFLTRLFPLLPADLLADALAAARAIPPEYERTVCLANLVPYLPTDKRRAVLADALATSQTIDDSASQTYTLAELSHYLPPEQQRAVLEAALAVAATEQNIHNFRRLLKHLAPHLAPDLLAKVLDLARKGMAEHGWYINDFVSVLAFLAPYLPEDLVSKELIAARRIRYSYSRAEALTALVPYVSSNERSRVLVDALTAVQEDKDYAYRAHGLARLAPHLTPDLLTQALMTAREIQSKYYRAVALATLVPHLLPSRRALVLIEALAAHEFYEKDSYITHSYWIPPNLPPDVLADALSTALHAAAPHLPARFVRRALTTASKIQGKYYRALALTGLIPCLPAEQRQTVLTTALAVAQGVSHPGDRAYALTGLIPYLPAEQGESVLRQALTAALKANDDRWSQYRAKALVKLFPYVPSDQLVETLAAVRRIPIEENRIRALAELAPYLLPAERLAVLAEALITTVETDGAENVFTMLVGQWDLLAFDQAYSLWVSILSIAARARRSSLLIDLRKLAPIVAKLGGVHTVHEALLAIEDVAHWWP